MCLGQQHKSEFAPLAEQNAEHEGTAPLATTQAADHDQHQRFQAQQHHQEKGDVTRVIQQQTQVHGHADRQEKQPQQQALEGLNVGFQLLPIGRVGQQHTRNKRTQAHGQAQVLHQRRRTQHQHQCTGGHQLPVTQLGQPAQPGVQRILARQHHGHQRRQARQQLRAVLPGLGASEHRQQQQDGNHRQILKQQNGKRGAALRGAQLVVLYQHLHHKSCGRQRQRRADGQALVGAETHQPKPTCQQQRAEDHLAGTQSHQSTTLRPQLLGGQFQPHQKQHQHHTQLGKVQHIVTATDQAKPQRSYCDTSRQVAQDAAQSQPLKQRQQHQCRPQQHQRLREKSVHSDLLFCLGSC